MPALDTLDLPMLFPVYVPESFDSVTTRLSCFLTRCELYYDILVEPKPTGWGWVQFMLSRLTGPATPTPVLGLLPAERPISAEDTTLKPPPVTVQENTSRRLPPVAVQENTVLMSTRQLLENIAAIELLENN